MESREKRRVKASTMPRTGVKMDTGAMVDKLATVGVEVDADDHEVCGGLYVYLYLCICIFLSSS